MLSPAAYVSELKCSSSSCNGSIFRVTSFAMGKVSGSHPQ